MTPVTPPGAASNSKTSGPSTSNAPADEAKRAASETADEAKAAAHDVADTAEDAAGDIVQTAKSTARDVTDQASSKAEGVASEKKGQAADVLGDASTALHGAADSLRDDHRDAFAQYAEQAATQVEQFSASVRDRSVGELLDQAERFARREPGLFIGGAFLLGIAGSRFLKASASEVGGASGSASDSTSMKTGSERLPTPTSTASGATASDPAGAPTGSPIAGPLSSAPSGSPLNGPSSGSTLGGATATVPAPPAAMERTPGDTLTS